MTKAIPIKEKYPPGDFAVWIIIYIELLTFALLFLGYAFSRRGDLELFNASQLALSQTSGFINTLILITSSYFVVKAVQSIKKMNEDTYKKFNAESSKWLLMAMLFGLAFLVIKITEFTHIFGEGIHLSTNKFFMFYILLTGFHFMHVLLGTVVLFNVYQKCKINGYKENEHGGFESAASYWHMVDLLWVVLFPLIYIMR